MVPTVAACTGHWHIWDTEKRVAHYWGEIGWDQERPLKGANYKVQSQKIILTSGSVTLLVVAIEAGSLSYFTILI